VRHLICLVTRGDSSGFGTGEDLTVGWMVPLVRYRSGAELDLLSPPWKKVSLTRLKYESPNPGKVKIGYELFLPLPDDIRPLLSHSLQRLGPNLERPDVRWSI
jgi:hypothetical protein